MAEKNLSIDWKQWYSNHTCSLEDVAKAINGGDCLWMGQASEIPYELLDYMYDHKEEYNDGKITFMYNVMNVPNNMVMNGDTKEHFKLMSAYNLPLERIGISMDAIECGGTTYDYLQIWPQQYNCNGYALQICPPDENGYCNVGHYGIATKTVIVDAPYMQKKIGFIDKTGQFPIPGDYEVTSIHVSELDYIVENMDTDLSEIPSQPPTDKDKKIASYILPYIHEHDKVQIGFGGLGEEILANLKTIGKMEIYSEVFCDNMAALCEEGVLTKITASSPGACSKVFMDFISKDPRATVRPQPETIDPLGVMKQENIVAINATFQCDLIGQCCSEAQGLNPYSGPGGSFSYIYGATRAKGGRSFICLRSTYTDHDSVVHSNVHPWLPEGCIVTTPKQFVMYLVTEWGIADVFLKTMPDRIKAVLKIAHPDFRQELKDKILTTPLITETDFGADYDLFDNVEK